MTLTTQIIISVFGGAAIIFCLYSAANINEAIGMPITLGFLMMHIAVGKIIDLFTGKNGFRSVSMMIAPQIHETAVIPTILIIWIISSGLIFCLLWIWQRYFQL